MKRAPVVHNRIFDDEAFAEEYAQGHRGMAERLGQEYAKKLAARGFEQGKILDVGCGFGATNVVLAQAFAGCGLVGIDLSDPLLALARRAAREANLDERVRFERADVQHIPFEDDSFDVVLNLNMVHLVERPVQMLDEIERVLAPDGHLFVADLRRSWLGLVEREIKSAFTLAEARDLFGQSTLRPGTFSQSLIWWRFES